MPFLTAGDPDLATTAALIREVVARGASLVEVGLPYSDPIADGPVIAASYARALRKGVKQSEILDAVRSIRAEADGRSARPRWSRWAPTRSTTAGASARSWRAGAAGFDGVIIPDLPVEESAEVAEVAAGST